MSGILRAGYELNLTLFTILIHLAFLHLDPQIFIFKFLKIKNKCPEASLVAQW